MKTSLKRIFTVFGGLVILVVLTILILPSFINPNDYKDKLLGFVEQKTGRQVNLLGDIDLSLSWGLDAVFNLGQVTISGIAPFADKQFAASDKVEVEMGLWPLLLKKELNISKVILKGARLNLIKDKSGVTNWQSPKSVSQPKTKPAEKKAAALKQPEKKAKKLELPKINLGGILAEDIQIQYDDQQSGQSFQLKDFNVESGHLQDNKEFPFKLAAKIDLKDAKGKTHSSDINLQSILRLNNKNQQIYFKNFNLSSAVISDVLAMVKQPITASLNGHVDLSGEKIHVDTIDVKFDQSVLKGKLLLSNFKQPSYSADLHIDSIDLDRYRKKKVKEAAKPFLLPVLLLKSLSFDGNITIDKLNYSGIDLSDISIKAIDNKETLKVSDLSAKLYGGTVNVQGELDMAGKIPQLDLSAKLDHVQMESLLKDLKDTDDVSGIAQINAKISSIGTTDKEMIRKMNGDLTVELKNGMVKPLQIIKVIRIAKALYLQQPFGDEASDQPSGFATLTAKGKIKKGVFHTTHINAQSDIMKVSGNGKADLADKTVDYKLNIYLASTLKRDLAQGRVIYDEAPIVYTVKGPISDLDQDADVTQVLADKGKKLLMNEVKRQLQGSGGGSILDSLKMFGR